MSIPVGQLQARPALLCVTALHDLRCFVIVHCTAWLLCDTTLHGLRCFVIQYCTACAAS